MTSAKPRPPLIPGETQTCPVLPLRDIVVFPHTIAPLFVGRKKSILALGGGTSREANLIFLSCRPTSIMGPPVGGLFSFKI